MKKLIGIIGICLLLANCSSKNQKMCDCLEASEAFNQFSAKILMKEVSSAEFKEMKKLKLEKVNKCKDFQEMSGEEMLKLKTSCQD